MYVSPRNIRTSSTPTSTPTSTPRRQPLSPAPTPPRTPPRGVQEVIISKELSKSVVVVQLPPARAAHNGDLPSAQPRVLTSLNAETRAALIERLPALTRQNVRDLLSDRAACVRCGRHARFWGSVLSVNEETGAARCGDCDAEALVSFGALRELVSALLREPACLSDDLIDSVLIEAAAKHLGQTLPERQRLIRLTARRRAEGLPSSEERAQVWLRSEGERPSAQVAPREEEPAEPAKPSYLHRRPRRGRRGRR